MTAIGFLVVVAAAGLGGFAVLRWLGLDHLEAWAGGRMAGMVAVALPCWWLAVLGVEVWRPVGAVLLLSLAAVGGVVAWKGRAHWRDLAMAEVIFIAGFLLVLFIRLDHPQIAGQEKPMDVGIFASLLRAQSFPPPDMWLAGEPLPYYYWGALVWTVPISMGRLPLEIAYNLVVGIIGGLVFVALWALGRRLAGGSHAAGLMAGFFGLFAGTPDGLRQWLGGTGLGHLDVWKSSRQHEDLITEFPLFTAWLGDLHPHLLSLPIACLAMLVAWKAGGDGPRIATTGALAALFGITWSANPWAMPPTLAAISLLLLSADGRWHWPTAAGWRRWLAVVGVLLGGWLVTAPFHLGFRPFFEGIGLVFAWTAPLTLLLYGGCLLIPAFGAALALTRQWIGEEARGRALLLGGFASLLVLAMVSHRPTLVVLCALFAVMVSWLVGPGVREGRPAVALAALGVLLFVVPEVVHVIDGYGDRLHRMNTVFKSWIQAWIFLSLALPMLLAASCRRQWIRRVLVVLLIIPASPHLVWMVLNQFSGRPLGLDGMAWMPPGDRAIVENLREQPVGTTMIEAVGAAYSEYGRLSANSGVPTYLGWENHELVWRGREITDETGRRSRLVQELYRCGNPRRVKELVATAGVDLVAIGWLERNDFAAQALDAVVAAGEVELDVDGGILVRFDDSSRPETRE